MTDDKINPFTTDDVDAAVTALANNAYLGEEGPLERNDLEEIVRIVLSNASARGRLLPSGGEVSTQWAVRWVGYEDGIVEYHRGESYARYVYELYEPGGIYHAPGKEVELLRRVTHAFDDGSYYVTPWSPVVSDNTDERPQWAIRDADGNTGDYAADEREIRRSWAQGITWWDPEGSYELCRREGPDAPWEVVERHPVVSDNSEEGES